MLPACSCTSTCDVDEIATTRCAASVEEIPNAVMDSGLIEDPEDNANFDIYFFASFNNEPCFSSDMIDNIFSSFASLLSINFLFNLNDSACAGPTIDGRQSNKSNTSVLNETSERFIF